MKPLLFLTCLSLSCSVSASSAMRYQQYIDTVVGRGIVNISELTTNRYILEKTPNYQEDFKDSLFVEMCARCHSGARVGLQRRPSTEWDNLVNFHLGKFPTLEYQALARDRDWFDIAQKQIVP